MNFKTIIANVVGDSYYAHRVVTSMFPEGKCAFYRKDEQCIIFSENAPLDSYDPNTVMISSNAFQIDDLLDSTIKMFTLEVNPIVCKNGKKGKVERKAMDAWIVRKFAEIGCDVKQHIIVRGDWDVFDQPNKGNKISMYCYEIMGLFEITDIDLFKKGYFNRMGQGKSFGYGLVNILN
jgi:CRISPR-associated protein Cas6/Cse3/CasE subtype I-E